MRWERGKPQVPMRRDGRAGLALFSASICAFFSSVSPSRSPVSFFPSLSFIFPQCSPFPPVYILFPLSLSHLLLPRFPLLLYSPLFSLIFPLLSLVSIAHSLIFFPFLSFSSQSPSFLPLISHIFSQFPFSPWCPSFFLLFFTLFPLVSRFFPVSLIFFPFLFSHSPSFSLLFPSISLISPSVSIFPAVSPCLMHFSP